MNSNVKIDKNENDLELGSNRLVVETGKENEVETAKKVKNRVR